MVRPFQRPAPRSVTVMCALLACTMCLAAFDSTGDLHAQIPVVAPITVPGTSVTLVAPPTGSAYVAPAAIALQARVAPSVTVSQVEFYANQLLIATVRNDPFATTWAASAGSYTLTAVARTLAAVPLYSQSAQVTVAPADDTPLLQSSDLTYEGAFRLPAAELNGTRFGFGGTAMSFNPAGNSLFIVGHDWNQRLAEVTIPEIRDATTVEDLAVASFVQVFADPVDGKRRQANPGDPNDIKLGGTLVSGDQLIVSAFAYYDGGATQVKSHFRSGVKLDIPNDVIGPVKVGTGAARAGYVSGYMATVPAPWRDRFGGPAVTGQCCIPIINRTSSGPALFSFNPADVGVQDPVPATPLVYYPLEQPLDQYGATSKYFNGSTEVRGVVFPERTRSVLFFGRHGTGPFCYGAGGATPPAKPEPGVTWCNDPDDEDKGTHAYPYAYYVWAYDANDLASVKNGFKEPWAVRPYAVWELPRKFRQTSVHINGAAYDPATGRIFLTRAFADGERPVVLVYKVPSPQ